MKWFSNLKIKIKLLIGFLVVGIIAAIVGFVGIYNINTINTADTALYEDNTLGLRYGGETSTMYQRSRYNALKLTLQSKEGRQKAIDTINDCITQVDSALVNYEATFSSENANELLKTVKTSWEEYRGYIQQAIQLVEEDKIAEAQELLLVTSVGTGDIIRDTLDELTELDAGSAKEKSVYNDNMSNKSVITMIAVIVIGFIMAILLGLGLANMISVPIKLVVEAAKQLALGNVSVNVDIASKDEMGIMAQAFNTMIDNIRDQALTAERIANGDLTVKVTVRSENDLLGKKLLQMVENNNEVLTNIATAADQVTLGAKQIADSSINLSQGATEQASSVEELTASLEEISSQTNINAKNASQANELAELMKQNAIQGNEQMKEMLKAMEDINESSNNISKIIKVIDDIAFQTNILALNAAVEAARAGQHGKGFAVVAEEVRNLAARSASASKETTDMIESSMKKSLGGTKIAKDTAEALNMIVTAVEKAAGLVNNIAIASNEQAVGISQINQGLMQVSQVVQSNSAMAEESAAASEELSSQASVLKEEVNRFKIKRNRRVSYGKEEISPEVITMLNSDRNAQQVIDLGSRDGDTTSKRAISLNDNEFGKY